MLKGKTILIGKEPGKGRLLIAVNDGGNIKSAAIGEIDSVPGSVSRCKPAEGVGHCRITIDTNSVMTIVNLKPQNVTFVNGTEIATKRITADSTVSLGKDMYAINVGAVLETATRLVSQPQGTGQKQIEVSIKHLKSIWDKYDTALLNLQIEQQKKANQQRLQGIVSMSGMLLAILPSAMPGLNLPDAVQGLRVGCIFGALGLGIYFFIKGSKVKDSFQWKKRELDQRFMDEYVCPNNDCRHFMGTQPYKILSQNKKCPHCGCKYSEK